MVTTGALRLPIGLVVVLSAMHVTQVSCRSGFPDDSGSSLVAGGCAEAQLCCHGKNHTCGVTETLTNVTMATKCFCDSECLLNRDCCHDYRDYCQRKFQTVILYSMLSRVERVCGNWGGYEARTYPAPTTPTPMRAKFCNRIHVDLTKSSSRETSHFD